jgi:hypothetical protein
MVVLRIWIVSKGFTLDWFGAGSRGGYCFSLFFLFDLLLGDIDPLLSSGSFFTFTMGGERMVFPDYGFAPNPRLRYAELGSTCLLCVLRHPRP